MRASDTPKACAAWMYSSCESLSDSPRSRRASPVQLVRPRIAHSTSRRKSARCAAVGNQSGWRSMHDLHHQHRGGDQQHAGNGVERGVEVLDDVVDPALEVARHDAERDAERQQHQRGERADDEAGADATSARGRARPARPCRCRARGSAAASAQRSARRARGSPRACIQRSATERADSGARSGSRSRDRAAPRATAAAARPGQRRGRECRSRAAPSSSRCAPPWRSRGKSRTMLAVGRLDLLLGEQPRGERRRIGLLARLLRRSDVEQRRGLERDDCTCDPAPARAVVQRIGEPDERDSSRAPRAEATRGFRLETRASTAPRGAAGARQ